MPLLLLWSIYSVNLGSLVVTLSQAKLTQFCVKGGLPASGKHICLVRGTEVQRGHPNFRCRTAESNLQCHYIQRRQASTSTLHRLCREPGVTNLTPTPHFNFWSLAAWVLFPVSSHHIISGHNLTFVWFFISQNCIPISEKSRTPQQSSTARQLGHLKT